MALAAFIDRMHITQLFMPPSVLKLFKPAGNSLRLVTTGSERVSDVASRDYSIYNLYGMSKTCAAVTAFPIDKPYHNTPIGRAMEGCAVYLLDENGQEADEGEICVAGHLMTGYIGMPEKTAEVKVKNPHFSTDGHKTMIRTGDLGRRDENGNIIYVNRKDWMIKINGQRVEPGEIEAVIREIPQIANAAVKGFTNENNHSYLCAYYVTKGDIQESEIRLALSMDQPLIPYQTYYLDYQLYSPRLVVTNLPFVCCAPRKNLDAQALKQAVDKVTHHFAIFGTVFLFNEAGELVQRYCPERIPEIKIVKTSEAEYQAEVKNAFFKPFRMLNSILWRGQIVVTEANVYMMLDFNHAISDGTMAMRTFQQIFETLNGRELQKDHYYLFLQRYARFMETPEGLAELESVRKLYDGDWSKFPQPDFDVRGNSNRRIVVTSRHTAETYQAAASGRRISLGTALVTAGQLALSRFNQQKKVAVEWIYNVRNEQWKNHLIGITICGIPATMDFGKYAETDAILDEARRQNAWGLRYAEHSYALRDMSPAKNECLKIVYEHGIDVPENIPEWFQIEADTDHFTGMLGLFQIIIFESTPDAPLTLIATYQGSRYREESARSMLCEFERALNELLGLPADEN